MSAVSLPIDSLLPELIATLKSGSNVMVEAPPGAGKTTRVPRAIDDARLTEGAVWVLEPRRLATRLAARRLADERGEALGTKVGYRIRFEERAGPETRILFVTEGILLRRLAEDPLLEGVGVVVLDEFHERHLQSDLGLALCKRAQAARSDLRLVVMSATLEADPLLGYLGGAKVLRAEGRRFDVAIEHAERPPASDRPLELDVAQALGRLVASGLDGDVLVFLPGAKEIRRALKACQELARRADLELVALHGDLPVEEQDRAIRLGPRRKVILSTNVAETSLTIEGVVAVIDSGLARVAAHSPWSGLPTLRVQRISRASAAQRAGRAGRLREGRCLRLYTRHDHDSRPAQETPEVRRIDLAEALLQVAAAGPGFEWFESPPQAALEAAQALLRALGALDASGQLTPLGRRMVKLPLHPRQSRLLFEAEGRGVASAGCILAARLGVGPLVARGGAAPGYTGRSGRFSESGPSDLLADLDRFYEAERARFDPDRLRSLGLDAGAAITIDRTRRQLERELGVSKVRKTSQRSAPGATGTATSTPRDGHEQEVALGLAILAGFPDRVAKRRRANGRELVLSGGGQAELDESSVIHQGDFMVAVDVEERSTQGKAGQVKVRSASVIEPEWLVELFPERLREIEEAKWVPEGERVERVKRLLYDQLVLEERRLPRSLGPEVGRVLAEAACARGTRAFVDGEALDRLLGRIAFVRRVLPEFGFPELGPSHADEILGELAMGASSFAELQGGALLEAILARLPEGGRQKLAEFAPERVTLLRGRAARVDYPLGEAPFIASRLQDFFGMVEGPRVARGRIPLVLHLLAPNQRAVQVTSDLAGFWERTYPQIRRELGRRYPRHAWPEDPKSGL